VKYDRFGAKTSQKYGNGLVTSYTYDSYTRRLSQITVADNSNNPYGDIQYGYDPVGNVTQVTSSCPWLQNQNFSETFTYDASDQLISASETNSGSYQLTVSYGNWGKITCYSLAQADLQNNTSQSEIQSYTYPAANSLQNSQTLFAPAQRTITDANNNVTTEPLTFGINGSLRKRDVQAQNSFTEYYLFNSAANLKAYSNNGLDFAYYGYNAANTRSYKLSFLNQNQWVNGQPEPLDLQLQSAMFYPNAYINFNQNGEYTKHYYNGSERIASRLGSNTHPTDATSNDRLDYRMMCAEEKFRENIQELVSDGQPVDFQGTVELNSLQPVNATSDIFYYHTNHLGSTAFVTDNNATITQGFLYAPFGEITTEYNANFGNDIIPKYSFNAKELDEETGMYYYEARYYKPPVFTSRDAMFEKYFWMTPYAYCANNPVKYVDPSGEKLEAFDHYSKRQMKNYFKQLFGTSKMFSFNLFKQVKIRTKQFDKVYASLSPDQQKLLNGFKEAIDRSETAIIKVDNNVKKFSFPDYVYEIDQNGNLSDPIKFDTEFSNLGGGTTMWSKYYSSYMIGVDNSVKNNLTTDNQDVMTGDPIATFVHETLDEFLNYFTAKNVNGNDSKRKRVEYQNIALRILNLPERNGEDHE
jgi:RHS repeat-associated protein